MDSDDDVFYDAPTAAGALTEQKWSDGEDGINKPCDLDQLNARRRSKVEFLKRSLIDKTWPILSSPVVNTGDDSNLFLLHEGKQNHTLPDYNTAHMTYITGAGYCGISSCRKDEHNQPRSGFVHLPNCYPIPLESSLLSLSQTPPGLTAAKSLASPNTPVEASSHPWDTLGHSVATDRGAPHGHPGDEARGKVTGGEQCGHRDCCLHGPSSSSHQLSSSSTMERYSQVVVAGGLGPPPDGSGEAARGTLTLRADQLQFCTLTPGSCGVSSSLPRGSSQTAHTMIPTSPSGTSLSVRSRHRGSLFGRLRTRLFSAVKSATRTRIFKQVEDTSDEDEKVIGNHGIRLRPSRQAKSRLEFLQVKLVQEMNNEHTGAIWAMRFSPCGRLLATAGYDRNIRIWVLRQWYLYFKAMQQSTGQSSNRSEFDAHSFLNSSGGYNPTFELGDEALDAEEDLSFLDSVSLGSTSVSTATGRTDDGVSSCSSSRTGAGKQTLTALESAALLKEHRRQSRSVFRAQPLLVYRAHEGVITEVAWSKNLFLLATSMDYQVRLWHVSRRECLCLFRHNDTVPTVVFHPKDDRYFLSGSLDGKLRLWNIPDKKVRFWKEVPLPSVLPSATAPNNNFMTLSLSDQLLRPPTDEAVSASKPPGFGDTPKTIITCATFACDGTKVVVGTHDGRVLFFTCELNYITFIAIKSGPVKGRPSRITAIELDPTDSNKILVTSNDSRLRLIDARDFHTLCKYRGFVNETSQIRASFSPSARYLISGSENAFFYIWHKSLEVDRVYRFSRLRKDRNSCWEAIKVDDTMVTAAIFCPNPNLVLDKADRRHCRRPSRHSCQLPVQSSSSPSSAAAASVHLGEVIVSANCNGCIRVFKKRNPSQCST